MPAPPVTHLLFGFFGTLVDYAPGGPGQGFARTYALPALPSRLAELGLTPPASF